MITCGGCDEPLTGELAEAGQPCPKCGSTDRVATSVGVAAGFGSARGISYRDFEKKPALFFRPALDRAEEFFEAFRQLPPSKGRPDWPRYFLFCHAIELALKAFLAKKGVRVKKLEKTFVHKIKPLMDKALSKGLNISPGAARAIRQLHEPHVKHWARYPSRDGPDPVSTIDTFVPHADELLKAVSVVIR